MKIFIGLFILLMTFSCTRYSKDNLSLIVKYQPDKTYLHTTEQTLLSIIKYSGKEKSLQTLRRRNILNPTIINKKSYSEATISTGKLQEDNRFTVKADYSSTTKSDNENQNIINSTFHGNCYQDSMPVFDVVVARDLDVEDKKYILDSWNKTFSHISFSGEKLKIGQELVSQNPLTIPMEGSEIEMVVTTIYKLIDIKDEIAYFDIVQHYKLNPKLLDNSFNGIGNGKGRMIYDINNNILLNYSLDTEMQLTKKLDSFEFQLNTNSKFNQTNKIVSK